MLSIYQYGRGNRPSVLLHINMFASYGCESTRALQYSSTVVADVGLLRVRDAYITAAAASLWLACLLRWSMFYQPPVAAACAVVLIAMVKTRAEILYLSI